MKNSNLTIGQKVAKENSKNEYATGTITELGYEKALVKFSKRGYSRWVSLKNLETVKAI